MSLFASLQPKLATPRCSRPCTPQAEAWLEGGLLQASSAGNGRRGDSSPSAHLRSIIFAKPLAAHRPLRLQCTLELRPRGAEAPAQHAQRGAAGLPGSKRKAGAAGLAPRAEQASAERQRYWDRARVAPAAVTVRYCSYEAGQQAVATVAAFCCPIKSCGLRCTSFTVRPLGARPAAAGPPSLRPFAAHARSPPAAHLPAGSAGAAAPPAGQPQLL